jgi:thymidine kinase
MLHRGWLHVITGPMFSGKTDEMMRHLRRIEVTGASITVVRPEIDTRTEGVIKSRSGAEYPCITVDMSTDILDIDTDVIAIDEAQFFDKVIAEVVPYLALKGHLVLVSGLDRDFLGRPFGPMPQLLAEADQVTKLTAVCVVCHEDGTMTQRFVNGFPAGRTDPLVVVGGIKDDRYEARCRSCHYIPPEDPE